MEDIRTKGLPTTTTSSSSLKCGCGGGGGKCACHHWQRVMQNVMYFVCVVLPAASGRTKWSRDGVERAVSWGHHCERAVVRIRHRGSLRAAITRLLRHNHHAASGFTDLLNARRLLLERLLQNQLLEEDMRGYVREVCGRVLSPGDVVQVERAARQQKEHSHTLLAILTNARHAHIEARLRARLMVEVAAAAGEGDAREVGRSLSKVAHSPVSLRAGLIVGLTDDDNDEGEGGASEVKRAVAQWINEVLSTPYHGLRRKVLKCMCSLSPPQLTTALKGQNQLSKSLLNCLNTETQKLTPQYKEFGCEWVTAAGEESVLSWEEIVRVYRVVSSLSSVREAVEGWTMEEGGAVWAEVVKQAKRDSMDEH